VSQPLVTHTVIGLCAALFAVMLLSGVSLFHPTSAQLLYWGANFGPFTLGGQWWRLPASIFLHIGIAHLLLNMWCLWNLGALAERLWGHTRFAALYLFAGAMGGLVSVAWHPFVVGAGASGAIFGVAGALIIRFTIPAREGGAGAVFPIPRAAGKGMLGSLLVFAGYNLVYGFLQPGIDNAAHIGGLAAGLVMGLLLIRRPKSRHLLLLAATALLVTGVLVAHRCRYAVHLERGRIALLSGKPDAAIAELTTAVHENPRFADSHFLLGDAYMRSSQFTEAEACFRRALTLQPDSSEFRIQLGLALAAQGRTQEARELFLELVRHEPRNPNALIGLGLISMKSGNYESALEAFRRAVQLAPYFVQAQYDRGLAAMKLQRYGEAIDAFSHCVQLEPNNYGAQLELAGAYRSNGMEAEAQAAYQRAWRLSPLK
jgi:rhomboid protease GluP